MGNEKPRRINQEWRMTRQFLRQPPPKKLGWFGEAESTLSTGMKKGEHKGELGIPTLWFVFDDVARMRLPITAWNQTSDAARLFGISMDWIRRVGGVRKKSREKRVRTKSEE